MQNAEHIRREYVIEFNPNSPKAQILLGFLIKHADTLRLTRTFWRSLWPFSLRKFGSNHDPVFRSQNEKLESAFLKKEINNKKYNDIEQSRSTYEHYFYKLDKTIVGLLQESGLFFHRYDPKAFYGFEDPTFYNQSHMVAAIMSHARLALLYLTEEEKNYLGKEGLRLALTTIQEESEGCLLPQ